MSEASPELATVRQARQENKEAARQLANAIAKELHAQVGRLGGQAGRGGSLLQPQPHLKQHRSSCRLVPHPHTPTLLLRPGCCAPSVLQGAAERRDAMLLRGRYCVAVKRNRRSAVSKGSVKLGESGTGVWLSSMEAAGAGSTALHCTAYTGCHMAQTACERVLRSSSATARDAGLLSRLACAPSPPMSSLSSCLPCSFNFCSLAVVIPAQVQPSTWSPLRCWS